MAAVIVPSFAKAGFRVGILAGSALPGCSSIETTSFAGLHRHRRDLAGEGAALGGPHRAGQALDGVGVLLLAGELVLAGGLFGEGPHQAARLIGVLEAVEVHAVADGVVADAGAGAVLAHEIRGVRHALHPPGYDDVDAAGGEGVMGHDRRLHAAAAHLVDRGRLDRQRQAGAERGLAGRGLAEAGGQHAAHDDLLDLFAVDTGPLDRGLHGGGAQLRRLGARKRALEAAHRRAGVGGDDDGIGGHGEDSCAQRTVVCALAGRRASVT